VYFGSDDFNVYALNASTGAKLWNFTTGRYVHSSPAIANGVVYVGSYDNKVYALDASTGAELWSYTTGKSVLSAPAVANGVLYAASEDFNVYTFGLPGQDETIAPILPRGSAVCP
ncbi:MAG: PQQ-binding-like beta-propeller repeat protein, partial [Candidatus Sulfotelmatobacter sp.]